MENSKPLLYCAIRDDVSGEWFGLDRAYRLIIPNGTMQAWYRLTRWHIVAESDSRFFPTMQAQAPAWAWHRKATGGNFTAHWFPGADERGVAFEGTEK